MTQILIIYDIDGWAFHARARALQKHAPPDFEVSIAPSGVRNARRPAEELVGDTAYDLIFTLSPRPVPSLRALITTRGWSTHLVLGWNIGWPLELDRYQCLIPSADTVLFNNLIYWQRTGAQSNSHAIANGVDLGTFNLQVPIAGRRPKVLWTGSHYHRETKAYDSRVVPLRHRLEAAGLDCDFRIVDSMSDNRRSHAEMAAWYNTGTVYVCTSDTEGTPNPALEAAACGCTVVSTPVGNMPELLIDGVNGYLADRTVEALEAGVTAAAANHAALATRLHSDIQDWGWQHRSQQYFTLFRSLLTRPGS